MTKNIVLCSDGTGNKGGDGTGTNVYKLYHAVKLDDPNALQITYYDNGVGTQKNKYVSGLTGAFGLGFKANVIDLYEFLARNYQPGDSVYMFGFSRGAATVRACAGMIQACGLLDIDNPKCHDEAGFQDQLSEAMQAYARIRSRPKVAEDFKSKMAVRDDEHVPGGDLPIKFVGVWDTVSALGFPSDWSWIVNWIFGFLEQVANVIFPHNFYNYQLNQNVKQVCHALAIDDERKTFHPKVWNEIRDARPENIEQVWFAGAHSNVGGGYPRAGLSQVPLDWMMGWAEARGLTFKDGARTEAHAAANVHDKLYDSRDGVAIYYRYSPRDIVKLCQHSKGEHKGKHKLQTPVKIHSTVIERIKRGTARYAPSQLPFEFQIAGPPAPPMAEEQDSSGEATRHEPAVPNKDWTALRVRVNHWMGWRKVLYRVFVEASLVIVAAVLSLWPLAEDLSKFVGLDGAVGWIFAKFGEGLILAYPVNAHDRYM